MVFSIGMFSLGHEVSPNPNGMSSAQVKCGEKEVQLCLIYLYCIVEEV